MKLHNKRIKYRLSMLGYVLLIGIFSLPMVLSARELTFEEALDIAVNRSSQGEIIKGNLEVAERNYFARRVNFLLPEISIRGSVPAYEVNETYAFLPGTDTKTIGKRKSLDFNSYINLDQNLITGGKFTFRAYLRSNEWEYPNREGLLINEERRLGSFDIALDQPILKPSDPKHELNNKKDDLEIARISETEEKAALKQEVTEVYIGLLQMSLHVEMAADRLESARLQAGIDSMKYKEEVLSEEDWLISASARLDAELEHIDIENQLATQRRELAMLLDLDSADDLQLSTPMVRKSISEAEENRLIAAADQSVTIRKAEHSYNKARRAAKYEASSKGLTGTLSANFSKESGRVETSVQPREDLDLDTWGVKLDFTYPIWDGGAAGSAVKAAELEAEKARIEYERAVQSSQAEVENLVNSIGISYRKLQVLDKQIALVESRLDIAKGRFENGEISRITYLESSVDFLETRNKYLEELKNYFVDTFKLEGKFNL